MTELFPGETLVAARFEADTGFSLRDHLVMLCRHGSVTHGTDTAESDVDLRAVIVPPVDVELGLQRWSPSGTWRFESAACDLQVSSARHELELLASSNPDALQRLWLRPEDYLYLAPSWEHVLAARSAFASRAAWRPMAGYSANQLSELAPVDPDLLTTWNAHAARLLAAGHAVDDVLRVPTGRDLIRTMPEALQHDVQEFLSVNRRLFGKGTRARRREAILRHGYDVRAASHLIRLLRMLREFLACGEMQVFRATDAAELLAIKQGAWPNDHVTALAASLIAEAEAAYTRSPLPDQPDQALVSQIAANVYRDTYGLPIVPLPALTPVAMEVKATPHATTPRVH